MIKHQCDKWKRQMMAPHRRFIIPCRLPKAQTKARIHKICNLALTFGRVQQVPICVWGAEREKNDDPFNSLPATTCWSKNTGQTWSPCIVKGSNRAREYCLFQRNRERGFVGREGGGGTPVVRFVQLWPLGKAGVGLGGWGREMETVKRTGRLREQQNKRMIMG